MHATLPVDPSIPARPTFLAHTEALRRRLRDLPLSQYSFVVAG